MRAGEERRCWFFSTSEKGSGMKAPIGYVAEVAGVDFWRFPVLEDFLVLLSVEASHSIYLRMEHGFDFDGPFVVCLPRFVRGCALYWRR